VLFDLWGMVAAGLLVVALLHSGIRMLRYSIDFEMYSEGYLETPMWVPQAVMFGGAILLLLAVVARLATLFAQLRNS
jgi:hypothetical protein